MTSVGLVSIFKNKVDFDDVKPHSCFFFFWWNIRKDTEFMENREFKKVGNRKIKVKKGREGNK